MQARGRGRLILAALGTLFLGLLTRPARRFLPAEVTGNLGDGLYALLVFLLIALVFPRLASRRVFAAAFGFCVLVECSQLYQAPQVNALRHTLLGGLVLGYGFSWGDIAAYFAGASAGLVIYQTGPRNHTL